MQPGLPSESFVLALIVVVLLVGGVLAFAAGQTLLAGVCFLSLSFAIYLRETRA